MAVKIQKIKGFRNGEVSHEFQGGAFIGTNPRPGRVGLDSRKPVSAEEDALYKMPLEETRAHDDAKEKKRHWGSVAMKAYADIGAFLEEHPELSKVDERGGRDADRNLKAFIGELQKPENIRARERAGRVGLTEYNGADWENAYEVLAARGELVLDQQEMYKKELAAARERAQLTQPDESEAYAMPLHKLKALANHQMGIDDDPLGPQY